MRIIALILGMAGLISLVCEACGKPSPSIPLSIENAAAVDQYEALLEQCRKTGKDAGSYAVYQTCADAVDRELCAKHRLRCQRVP